MSDYSPAWAYIRGLFNGNYGAETKVWCNDGEVCVAEAYMYHHPDGKKTGFIYGNCMPKGNLVILSQGLLTHSFRLWTNAKEEESVPNPTTVRSKKRPTNAPATAAITVSVWNICTPCGMRLTEESKTSSWDPRIPTLSLDLILKFEINDFLIFWLFIYYEQNSNSWGIYPNWRAKSQNQAITKMPEMGVSLALSNLHCAYTKAFLCMECLQHPSFSDPYDYMMSMDFKSDRRLPVSFNYRCNVARLTYFQKGGQRLPMLSQSGHL